MKTILLSLSAAALLLLANGCATGGAYEPKNTTKYDLENTAQFVLFDAGAQHSVTCPGIQTGKTVDGRMKVLAHLRNRENRRIEVQANCVFKDVNGVTTGDETPFQAVILTENATEQVKFVSMNDKAKRYTIRVRQAR